MEHLLSVHLCRVKHREVVAWVALELTKLAFAHGPERQFISEDDALRAIGAIYQKSLKIAAGLNSGGDT